MQFILDRSYVIRASTHTHTCLFLRWTVGAHQPANIRTHTHTNRMSSFDVECDARCIIKLLIGRDADKADEKLQAFSSALGDNVG